VAPRSEMLCPTRVNRRPILSFHAGQCWSCRCHARSLFEVLFQNSLRNPVPNSAPNQQKSSRCHRPDGPFHAPFSPQHDLFPRDDAMGKILNSTPERRGHPMCQIRRTPGHRNRPFARRKDAVRVHVTVDLAEHPGVSAKLVRRRQGLQPPPVSSSMTAERLCSSGAKKLRREIVVRMNCLIPDGQR